MRTLKTPAAAALLLGSLFALTTAVAAQRPALQASASARADNVAQEQTQLRQLLESPAAPKRAVPGGEPKAMTPEPNSYRAYAPSCVHDPLPEQTTGPTYTKRVKLAQYPPDNNGVYGVEEVTVTVWRVPCSSSGQFYDAVTIVGIDRDPINEGNSNRYPYFPGLRLTQGSGIDLLVRMAEEPNTVRSHVYPDESLINSGTYVLENFASNNQNLTRDWEFNDAFRLTFLNFFNGALGAPQDMDIPAYNPNQNTYPTAFQNVPITGYLTGNYYDAGHGGEGMLIQIFDLPVSEGGNKLFTFAWFTYDRNGLPFWLFGAARFPVNSRGPISVPTIYQTNGGFAGNFGANANSNPWGTVTFEFPSCNKMKFTYDGSAAAVNGPSGTGTRENWSRQGLEVNGLKCE
jgi:hypothetical protein